MPAVNHELLRHRRDELDLSNANLAARMGANQGYVENVVSGADNPGWRLIYKLSRALDLPVERIVLGDEQPAQPAPAQPAAPRPKDPSGPRRRQDLEPTKAPRRASDAEAVVA